VQATADKQQASNQFNATGPEYEYFTQQATWVIWGEGGVGGLRVSLRQRLLLFPSVVWLGG